MNITQKTILITGANRGVGRALLEAALERGASRVYAGTRAAFQHADKRVIPVTLDVTNAAQIERVAQDVGALDLLVNNAGISLFDDLSDPGLVEQHLAVNFYGPYRLTQALLPRLAQAHGAILNVLSLAALAPLPVMPAYSISKAAAHSLTQTLRAYLVGQGVAVHAVLLGPVDTDMTRGFDIPKAAPDAVARAIFDGLARGEEDIFPDPVSRALAEGWRNGVVKAFEHEYASLLPASVARRGGDYTLAFTVDQTPQEAFRAINDVRGWWSGEVEGDTSQLGGEFSYRVAGVHYSKQKITESVPGKKVAWHVTDAQLEFVKDKSEWKGTDIVFEIAKQGAKTEVRFTHKGLASAFECYTNCSNAWGMLVNGNLRKLIATGKPQPSPW